MRSSGAVLVWLWLAAGNSTGWAGTRTWTSLGSPGVISVIAVSPHDPRTIYAGADSAWPGLSVRTGAHVFKSTDGGLTWNDSSNGLPPGPSSADGYQRYLQVSALVIDPTNPNTLYVGISSVYWAPP